MMIEKIKTLDWDNFRNLNDFVEAEKISVELQEKIHAFHESFLISKSYTIDELAEIPNINWLYIRKHMKMDAMFSGDYEHDGTYLIDIHGASYKTRKVSCTEAGTRFRYDTFFPDSVEKDFFNLINKTVINYRIGSDNLLETLLTKEQAEIKCKEYNDLLRHDITNFMIYQGQSKRFIINSNNSPIMIPTNGCIFKIDYEKNHLIIETSSFEYNIFNISRYYDRNFNIKNKLICYDLVFDIQTNNLVDIISKDKYGKITGN